MYGSAGVQSETCTFQVPEMSPVEKDNFEKGVGGTNDEVKAMVVGSWELILQFLGTPQRARLTTMPNHHFLDLYFP